MRRSAAHAATGDGPDTPIRLRASSPVDIGQERAGHRTRAARRAKRTAAAGRGGPTSSDSVQERARPSNSLRRRPV
eukprot:scaffold5609_cov135-Isochrysis_galbana.AAC.1